MEFSELLWLSGAVILLHMSLYYLLSLWLKDTSIVDIAWGLGFALIALVQLLTLDNPEVGNYLVNGVVIAWGLRLALHIYLRKKGQPEDWRYLNWRNQWGKTHWWRSFLQVFMLQGLIMWIMAMPISVASYNTNFTGTWLVMFGFGLWLLGFFFEAVGDYQLREFISNPANRGRIMRYGLWSLTRHPNYFGEITMWWGIFLMVAQLELGIWAIVSPIMITFMLLKVSGVTMLEKKYDNNPEYQKYKKQTSAIVPWPF